MNQRISVGGWSMAALLTTTLHLASSRAPHQRPPLGAKNRLRPKAVQDLRVALDDKSVAAVVIAAPNHWHALTAIWAMQAGKDVYVQKPVSHNVSEGRRIVQVARKLGHICQGGTQNRSNGALAEAIHRTDSKRWLSV